MRTLVDLLNTEDGYARIFYERDSYGYQLHAYQPALVLDLFERMNGFTSLPDACEAARHQLAAMASPRALKGRKESKSRNQGARARSVRPAKRRRPDGGSIGLL